VDCNNNKEGNGDGNEGGEQLTAMATKRAMAAATRLVVNKEGNGDSGKSNGDNDEGGRRALALVKLM
jgi:hypothetical protein